MVKISLNIFIFAAKNERQMLIPDPELFLKYLAQKDNKAFQHLYGMYFSALKALAVNYVKDEDEAEDLVQEVFITLLESNHRFQSVDEVKYFLYNILKNKCISHYRKQKVRDRYRQEMQDAEEPREDFWAKVLEEDVYAHLMAAIEVLPPQCRLVMKCSLEGLRIAEIADRLRISEETVKEHKQNGKRKLVKMLDNPFLEAVIFFL